MGTLKDYVPRHKRLGVCCEAPEIEAFQEVREEIPLLDDNGKCVQVSSVQKRVPVAEVMAKYKLEQFKLSALVDAGVPLKMVNINSSNTATLDKLYRICQNMDDAEKYVQKLAEQERERAAWLQPVEKEEQEQEYDELNEIY